MGMKFINLPKSKQFEIVTRYYDPQQEVLHKQEEHANQAVVQNNESTISYRANIKGKFRSAGKKDNSKSVEEARRKSNMRLIYILIILCALFYFFLNR